jgi:hypothetical protein
MRKKESNFEDRPWMFLFTDFWLVVKMGWILGSDLGNGGRWSQIINLYNH